MLFLVRVFTAESDEDDLDLERGLVACEPVSNLAMSLLTLPLTGFLNSASLESSLETLLLVSARCAEVDVEVEVKNCCFETEVVLN